MKKVSLNMKTVSRKMLFVLLVIVIAVSAIGFTACEGPRVKYTLNSDGKSYTFDIFGRANFTEYTIPSTYKNKPVTEIGTSAFLDSEELTSVTIPDSVTKIGYNAFMGCTNLTSVTMGNGVKEIGEDAFNMCVSLKSITIPDSVVSIGRLAFGECISLETITIGKGVKKIDESAFNWCESLTSVYYTGDVESYCKISYGNDASNPVVFAHNLYINNSLVTELTIPNTVTELNAYTFGGCSNITQITIPSSVTAIELGAFYECINLKQIRYVGTTAQWNKINRTALYSVGNVSTVKVICSDGEDEMF